jgi:Tfp pilus assembly protein PilO
MNEKRSRTITPRRIAIALSIILALIHVILLGWTLQRRSAIEQLEEDKVTLEENFSQLEEINQEQLDALQEELALLEEEIVQLQDSFPELDAPFALYRRGLDIAQSSNLNLQSIGLLSVSIQETISGDILIKQYSVETSGTTSQCLTFIDALEQAGAGSVAMDGFSMTPPESACSVDLSTIGIPTAAE